MHTSSKKHFYLFDLCSSRIYTLYVFDEKDGFFGGNWMWINNSTKFLKDIFQLQAENKISSQKPRIICVCLH